MLWWHSVIGPDCFSLEIFKKRRKEERENAEKHGREKLMKTENENRGTEKNGFSPLHVQDWNQSIREGEKSDKENPEEKNKIRQMKWDEWAIAQLCSCITNHQTIEI